MFPAWTQSPFDGQAEKIERDSKIKSMKKKKLFGGDISFFLYKVDALECQPHIPGQVDRVF